MTVVTPKPMARKILIVDDQADILLILERKFRSDAGVSVMTAKDYLTALSIIAEKEVDLLISDVRLGTMSGFDLIREVKAIRPNMGTMLMTAYRSPSNRELATELGVEMFFEKPFQIPVLIQEVDNYFRARETTLVPEVAAPKPATEPLPSVTGDPSALVIFKLQDLVQLFCLNGRNILISVDPGTGQPPGEIYIQRGNVIHATYNGRTGEEGFHALMRIPSPVLKAKDWAEPVPVTIKSSYIHLLLESAVHVDHEVERQASAG